MKKQGGIRVMRSLLSRRRAVACAASIGAVVALAAPGAANAGITTAHCKGANIEGNGATLQRHPQEHWTIEFNSPEFATEGGCLTTPTVKYNSTGSEPGLESWGAGAGAGKGNFAPTNNFVASEEPPNAKQKEQIEKEGTGGKLLTIPVMQAANAIVVHLPKGCTAKSKATPGRIALSNATLEKIFHGTLTSWKSIKNGKDKFKGKKHACEKPIQRVVRLDPAGTTSVVKRYLDLVEPSSFLVEGKSTTWNKLAEESPNTVWPEEKAHPLLRGKGHKGVLEIVAATESTIGYANLEDARKNTSFIPPLGGPGHETFWAVLENGSVKKGVKTIPTFADPSTNGEVEAKEKSNCKDTMYTNGGSALPSAEGLWTQVTTATSEPHYPLCGLSYDLSLTKFQGFKGATDEGTRTASDYLKFILEGGQKVIKGHDYINLPDNVLQIAKEGAAKISFS
jgi:ABC-type phosphate transport system substrate-binding protein